MALAKMTSPEAAEALSSAEVVLIPVGATEQHGPNMTLETDTTVAYRPALRIASALQPRAVVAPPLPYGVSYHHMSFPGTMTVSPEPVLHPAALWYARENAVRHSASRSLNILVIEHLGRGTASWNDFH